MKKKSQIRKYTVEKVEELTKQQTIPEMLKLYAEHVQQKKKKLIDKKNEMLNQLHIIRRDSQKIVFQMVDGVKDRLQKTQKIVMTAQSRPTAEDIKNLSDLFTYMENQSNLIHKNSEQTKQLHDMICQIDDKTVYQSLNFTQLDKQFADLQNQCAKQQIIRDRLLQQRDDNRRFYESIKNTIQEYRVKYDIVEAMIAQREKQLDHLVSYFRTRQQQDKQKIEFQSNITNQLEAELLKAQEIINIHTNKNMNLQIRQNECSHRDQQRM